MPPGDLLYRLLYRDICIFVHFNAVLCKRKTKKKKPESLRSTGFSGLFAVELIARFELATSSLPKA